MSTQIIHTDKAPAAIGPYSQAVTVDLATTRSLVFSSGQIGHDPATGILREGFEAQVDQAQNDSPRPNHVGLNRMSDQS